MQILNDTMSVEKFLQYLQYEKNYSSHTVLSYKNDILQFELFLKTEFSENDITKATTEQIRQWIVDLMGSGISARSANRKLSALKSLYRFLIREGIVVQNPTKNIITPKTKKPLPMFFREKEVDDAINFAVVGNSFEACRDRLILDLFFETGIRVSELAGIKDTDFDANALRIIGKRNKERKIPVGNHLLNLVQEYKKKRDEEIETETNRFFVCANGREMYPRLIYNIVRKYMSQTSSLAKRSPHVLRHTFASTMLNNGADLNAVKELLGHANLAATQVYTHTSFEQLQQIYKQAHPRAHTINH